MTAAIDREDETRREWLSFDHDGDTYLFDVTFLTSGWECIFGNGCKGVLEEDATELGHGCCTHGAHFADGPDRKRVARREKTLTADQWQLREVAADLGGAFMKNDDGAWMTRVHDGACIFLNRTDFDRGAGCALHVGALEADESFVEWKPEVCWQLPLRLVHATDEIGHTTYTLREWKRRDWGEGGEVFHWWCTEEPEAFIGREMVVETLRDEIVGLVGEPVYGRLVDELDLASTVTPVPHPAVRRRPSAV